MPSMFGGSNLDDDYAPHTRSITRDGIFPKGSAAPASAGKGSNMTKLTNAELYQNFVGAWNLMPLKMRGMYFDYVSFMAAGMDKEQGLAGARLVGYIEAMETHGPDPLKLHLTGLLQAFPPMQRGQLLNICAFIVTSQQLDKIVPKGPSA